MISSELVRICFLNDLLNTNNDPGLWFPAATLALISKATHRQLGWARTKALVENPEKIDPMPEKIVNDLARFCNYDKSTAIWNLGDAQRAQAIHKAVKVTPSKIRFVELIRATYDDFLQPSYRPALNEKGIDDFWELWDGIRNPSIMLQLMSGNPTVDQVRTISMFSVANNALS